MRHTGQGHSPVPWAYDKSRFCVFSGSRMTTGHSPLQMLTPAVKGGLSRQRGLFTTALRVERPHASHGHPLTCALQTWAFCLIWTPGASS